MIGSISIGPEDQQATAVLDEDGEWAYSGDTAQQEFLRLVVRAVDYEYGGPSDGPYGVRWLRDVAAMTGGVVEFEDKPSPPPGTVY